VNPYGKQKRLGEWVAGAGVVLFIALIIAVVLAFVSAVIVKPGTVGVLVRFGKVVDVWEPAGLRFRVPVRDAVKRIDTVRFTYETSEHPDTSGADYPDFHVDSTTLDGQRVHISYTIRFRVNPAQAGWVVDNYGNVDDLVERVVKADTRSYVRNIAREYEAAQLYGGEIFDFQKEVEDTLRPIFAANAVVLEEVLIRQPGFEQEYADAIESKTRYMPKFATVKRYRF